MTVKRMRFLQQLLKFVGLDGRLHLEWISSAEAQKYVRVVTEFTEKIKALGPNPLSGFKERIEALGPKPLAGLLPPDLWRPEKQPAAGKGNINVAKGDGNESRSENLASGGQV
ncbi:MAG: hydrogenase iron-sulfur subunit [Deltaproteobacteria bacterium]|jgi:F420-non-reducing hydrogenase iron-sulfur subunit|nr:hydrogenase iron-sulfur subunit [Deltaproteobacteria bacterium]MBW2485974.1 hydrogenase iron-sulfur subunit [Deltaproteobacteria bacterium]